MRRVKSRRRQKKNVALLEHMYMRLLYLRIYELLYSSVLQAQAQQPHAKSQEQEDGRRKTLLYLSNRVKLPVRRP